LNQNLERSLGISFSSNAVRYTELVYGRGVTELDYVDSAEADFDFETDLAQYKSNQKALTNLSGEIQKYLNARNMNFRHISLTISTSQAFLIMLPLDLSEGKHTFNSKVYWELSNYFPDTYADYIINTYRMSRVMPSSGTGEFLIIAVHKNTMEFVKRIFKMCNIELSVVDIDHFAAEQNLRKNYADELPGRNILLLGLKKGRFDYGFISDRKYSYYTYSKYISEPEHNLSLVRKLNSLLDTHFRQTGVDHVFVYGDDLKEDTIEAVKRSCTAKVHILNPFENINSSNQFLKNDELRKTAYRFAPSCGVALRSLNGK
jgi:Tfp pilus assembly PilM family ATPase